MSPFYFALCNAVVITLILLALKPKEHQESKTTYGIRIFVIVMIVSFVTFAFFIAESGSGINQEIDIGEAPF